MDHLDRTGKLPGGGTLTSQLPAQRHAAVRAMLLAEARSDVVTMSVPAPAAEGARGAGRRAASPPWVRWTGLVAAPALLAAAAAAVWAAGAEVSTPSSPVPAPQELMAWSPVPKLVKVPDPPAGRGPGQEEASTDWVSPCDEWMGGSFFSFEGAAAMSARATHHVLAEERAGTVLCVDVAFGDGTAEQQTIGLGGLDPSAGSMHSSLTGSTALVTPPEGGDVLVIDGDSTAGPHRGDANTALLYGAAGPQVSGVQLLLTSGVRVTASLRDGVWALWWPLDRGEAKGAQLLVSTAQGQLTVDPESVRMAPDPA